MDNTTPITRRPTSKAGRYCFFALFIFFLPGGLALGQQVDTLRILQYNLTNYGNNSGFCNNTNNGVVKKDGRFRSIIDYLRPDVWGCNEVGSNPTFSDRILALVLNANGRTGYARAATTNRAGSDIINAMFYDPAKVVLAGQFIVPTPIRDVNHYRFYALAGTQPGDTAFFNILVCHLKAATGTSDIADRERQAQVIKAYLATQNPAEPFIFQGDLNVYTSAEPGYQTLTNPATGGPFRDPLNRPGAWNNNASFRDVHTQSPRASQDGNTCLSAGGLDDRFDQMLTTPNLLSGQGLRLQFLSSAFRVIGNDGNHFNASVNAGTNTSVPAAIADSLYNASDHLPILGKVLVQRVTATRPTLSPIEGLQAIVSTTGIPSVRLAGATISGEADILDMAGRILATDLLQCGPAWQALPALQSVQPQLWLRVRLADGRRQTMRMLNPAGL